MIDYQSNFKKKLVVVFLFMFIVPFVIVLYIGQKSGADIKKNSPIFIKNTMTLSLRGTIMEVKLSKDFKTAYVVASSRGIYIVDIENPLKPKLISQFKYFKNSYDKARSIELIEDKNILFVRDAQAGIYSIDIENLEEPKLLSTYKEESQIYDFCISKNGDYLYVSDENGIKKLDIKNSDNIKTVATFNNQREYFEMVEVKENLIYLLSSHGIDIVDITLSASPKLAGNYLTVGDAKKITLSHNKTRAFLSSGYSGVEILNIENKLNPKSLGIYKSFEMVKNTLVSKAERILYVSNLNNTIELVDIENPDEAKLLKKININPRTKTEVWDMVLSMNENVLFIANGIGGVKVIELK